MADDRVLKVEVLAEVEVLGHLGHRNIVRLLGWCTNSVARLCLYEYMLNGSLDDLLHGATGADTMGKGVSYLHHDCVSAMAHRDLKPSNILLDVDMEARVADFNVAKALHGTAPMSVMMRT
ncbi:leucine-rich repeat receptor-like protein kinase TDR [Miscanthus floridulus]|uniref:leucine-rich repeat receptor-like protein kinase TDR n=1 Tax=Miscanthus floridulus TaxID=154761 RepID=UPI0034593EDF